MSIVRAPRPESRYLTVRNDVVRDPRLSYRAVGILVAILSLPDNASTSAASLMREGHERREAILSAFKELRSAGYMVQDKIRGEDGRIETVTYVYDAPQTGLPESENPTPVPTRGNSASPLVAPETGCPDPVNPTPKEEQPLEKDQEQPSEVSDPGPGEAIANQRPEVLALCQRLADKIVENGSKRPTITKGWRDAIRLMITKDERTPQQVANMIDWCQRDSFWRSNILSAPTLREKYDQMRLRAQAEVEKQRPARIARQPLAPGEFEDWTPPMPEFLRESVS